MSQINLSNHSLYFIYLKWEKDIYSPTSLDHHYYCYTDLYNHEQYNQAGATHLAGRGFVGCLQLLGQLTGAVAGCVREKNKTKHCVKLITEWQTLT